MGIIYFIQCLETNEIYIGSTTRTLEHRMYRHKELKTDCNRAANPIIKRGNWICDVLEEVEDNDKLREREQYYMDTTDCVNKWRAVADPDYDKKYQAAYRIKNKEKVEAYKKKKITCECGAIVCQDHIARHRKRKIHFKNMELLSSGI